MNAFTIGGGSRGAGHHGSPPNISEAPLKQKRHKRAYKGIVTISSHKGQKEQKHKTKFVQKKHWGRGGTDHPDCRIK